jgi:hypothetical protein
MENINKPQGLAKISEVPGAIKEIEHENSSEDVSSVNEKNNSKNSKQEKSIDSQISKKLDDLNKKLDLKQSEDETEKKSSELDKENENQNEEEKEKDSEAESSEDEGMKNASKSVSNSQYQEIKEANFHSIEEYYAELRKIYNEKNQYKDPDFSDVKNFFGSEDAEDDEKNLSDIGFDRIVYDDNKVNFFVYENSSNNLDYEFKIKRGIMKDRYFLGAFLMLFRRREEFFTDLILDPQHLEENINAGFIGFTFFINGEWKNVTIDTTVPRHGDEISLSNIETANAYWMCLFEKAYAKIFRTYTVLEMKGIMDFLVDFTGGWSKLTEFSNNKDMGFDENKKKSLFEEIQRALEIKSLVGCMKYDKTKEKEDLDDDKNDEEGVEDEAIVPNCMYNILDAREDNGIKLIYLVNYWPKGKWTSSYSVEDETWEANKALAERLNYQVSQSDGTFWMSFDDWLTYFNRIYYCRIFPETWSQMVIPGKWTSVTSGGAPPKVIPWYPEKFVQKEVKKDLFSSVGTPSMMATSVIKGLNKKTMGGQTSFYASPALGKTTMVPNNALTSNKLGQMISKKSLAPSVRVQPSINTINSKGLSQKSDKKSNVTGNNTTGLNQNKINEDKGVKTKGKKNKVAKVIYNPIKRNTVVDTEDRFFLNPQYKIEITPGTRLNISLMQEDKKTQENNYLSVAFLLIYCKGRYSRVWEIKEENIIRKAVSEFENPDDGEKLNKRETMIQVDYYDTLRKINEGRKKKIPRGEPIQMNLIPYIDYNTKYETERQGKLVQFKIHAVETVFWLRLFASTNIYVNELARPYECSATSTWSQDKNFSAGGARYITDRGKTRENSNWPINPQYLITFDKNISMKIILKKTNGHFSVEDNKIGFLMTKPEKSRDTIVSTKSKTASDFSKTMNNPFIKTDQISRVMESTQRILNPKNNLLIDIYPKMFINNSEWVAESSYSNSYCSCLFMKFNKIDSPLIIIPTLDLPNSPFDFELKIYSNRAARIFSLNNENCSLLIGEWKENNCGGCHLSKDDKKKKAKNEIDDYTGIVKKPLTWFSNPKFHLCFESKKKREEKSAKGKNEKEESKENEQKKEKKINDEDNNINTNDVNDVENKDGNNKNITNTIPQVEFEVVLTRFERIWKPIISRGVVNSMLGIYVFEYDTINWKKKCINFNTVEFMPQNEVSVKFSLKDVNPKGFIIMPVTYGEGIKGPFLIMAKCKTRFTFTQLEDNFE